MAIELKIPTLGESITEAVVGRLLKKAGDAVAADEAIAVLETDKVTIDLQAPAAGVIEALDIAEGAKVSIGQVVGRIAPGAGAAAAPAAAASAKPPPPPPPAAAKAAPPAIPAASRGAGPAATPVARAMAEERGIDPSSVKGSGVQGRVTKDDIAQAPAVAAKPAAPRSGERDERVAMTPLRKRVAERLINAQNTAAILTTFNEADMSAIIALRKSYQEKFEKKHGIKIGFMSFFARAVVEALKAFPAMNASIEGSDVVFHHYYDLGIAVSGNRGLVVPVVRDADQLSLAQLELAIADLASRARNDKLTLADLQGGTFTISNGGIFGSLLSTPILNPPQSGILGMHAIQERPVVRDGQIVVRPMMYLAVSYDHRLIDGRESVQFLVRVKECLEAPERMLLEV